MDTSADLRKYIALLRRWIWLVALAAILAGAAAYLVSQRIQPTYQSTTRILINQAPNTRSTDYTSLITSQQLAQTYAQTITAQPVLDEVAKNLSLPFDAKKLTKMTTVTLVRDTSLLDVAVRSDNPVTSAVIANELVKVFVAQTQAREASRYAASKANLEKQMADVDQRIQDTSLSLSAATDPTEKDRLQTTLAQYQQTYSGLLQSYEEVRMAEAQNTSNISQVQPALPNDIPISPKVMQNTLLAAIVGMMLAVGVIFLLEYLDDTLKTPDDVFRTLGLPVIGYIGEMNDHQDDIVVASEPRSPAAEAFRVLRTNIDFASAARQLKSVLVVSPGPSEGKSTVAINLAAVVAQSGKRVIMADADLRRPSQHRLFDLPNRTGFSDVFLGTVPLDAALQNTPIRYLRVLTSGSIPPNPSELLASKRMTWLIDELKGPSDLVVLDSPPFVVSDASVLASKVDGVLVVIQPGHTNTGAAKSMMEQLQRAEARVLGVVMNRIPANRQEYYGNYAHYSPYKNRYKPEYKSYFNEKEDGKPLGKKSGLAILKGSKKDAA